MNKVSAAPISIKRKWRRNGEPASVDSAFVDAEEAMGDPRANQQVEVSADDTVGPGTDEPAPIVDLTFVNVGEAMGGPLAHQNAEEHNVDDDLVAEQADIAED